MQHRPKTEEEQRAFYDSCLERAERAVSAAGSIAQVYELAGVRLRLVFAGERLLPVITPAMAHRRADDEGSVEATFLVWDSETTGIEFVRPPCRWGDFTDRGDIWGFDSERIRTAFHWVECSLQVFDRETRRGMFWVQSAEGLPFWVQASPLRTLLHWLMELHGAQLLHAAAVGTGDGAVVITGRGGVGKSTTALACLNAGLDYLADDYLVVRPGVEPHVHSLYNTAKLDADQVQHFPELAPLANNLDRLDQEKAIFYLHPEKTQLLAADTFSAGAGTPRSLQSLGSEAFLKLIEQADGTEGLHKVRPAGTYASSRGGDAHMEHGGPEGALIFFALQAVDGKLFETLDRDMNLLTTSTVEEMAKSLVAT